MHCKNGAKLQILDSQLARIQNDLFDLGADLATVDETAPALRITQGQVIRLEQEIDAVNANLQPLTSFILPAARRWRPGFIWGAQLPDVLNAE